MNNQTETPPPDFGFILNQAQPPAEKPTRSKKTTILVSIAVGLVVLTAGLYAFLPKQSDTPKAIPSVGAPTSGELLQAFVAKVQANESEEAFSLLSSDYQAKQNLETFTAYFVVPMNKNVKFDACVPDVIADPNQSNVLKTTCPMQRGAGKVTYTLTTKASTENGKDKVAIDTLSWKLDDKVTVADVQ